MKQRARRGAALALAVTAPLLLLRATPIATTGVVKNNAELMATPSYQYSAVLRLGVTTPGDAAPQWYIPSGTPCTISGSPNVPAPQLGDIGSQNPASDGGCFNVVWGAAPTAPEWGAKGDGTTDDSAALNAALLAVQKSGGGYLAGAGRRYYTGATSILIPAHVTFDLGDPSLAGYIILAQLNTAPAAIVSAVAGTTPAVKSGGIGVGLENGLLIKSATYPVPLPTAASPWTGIGFFDQAQGNMYLKNLEIAGFDSAVLGTGPNPYIDHVVGDGSGVTNAVFELDVGNTDAGALLNSRVLNVTSSANASNLLYPGTGVRVGAGSSIGNTMYLNAVRSAYMTTNFDFENGASIGWINADGATGDRVTTGVYIASGVVVNAAEIDTNQTIGASLVNNGTLNVARLQSGYSNGDCIQNNGILVAASTNLGACGNSAVKVGSAAVTSLGRLTIAGMGIPMPWIISSDGTQRQFGFGKLTFSGLSAAAGDLFDSNFVGIPGGEPMLAMMGANPTIAGTGGGTGATYTLLRNGGANFVMSLTAGAGAAATGTLTATMPTAASNRFCAPSYQSPWPAGSQPLMAASSGLTATVTWTAGAALTNGTAYNIAMNCQFQN